MICCNFGINIATLIKLHLLPIKPKQIEKDRLDNVSYRKAAKNQLFLKKSRHFTATYKSKTCIQSFSYKKNTKIFTQKCPALFRFIISIYLSHALFSKTLNLRQSPYMKGVGVYFDYRHYYFPKSPSSFDN